MAVSDEFSLATFAREQLEKAIADAERNFSKDTKSPGGYFEALASEALSPAKYQEFKQQQARERKESVIKYFGAVFFGHLRAHLDSGRDYRGMREVLPRVYNELFEQTFTQKWLDDDPFVERESEHGRFGVAVEHELNRKSEKWSKFRGVLDQMAVKAGCLEAPGSLSFADLIRELRRRRIPVTRNSSNASRISVQATRPSSLRASLLPRVRCYTPDSMSQSSPLRFIRPVLHSAMNSMLKRKPKHLRLGNLEATLI
jgi:hypothetical protein